MKRDFLSFADFSQKEIHDLLLLSLKLKKKKLGRALFGKSIGLVFQKPSTRTAVSFAVGVSQLGGTPLILNADILQIKRGESPRDTARVLSRYLDAIVIRANHHSDVLEMAKYATIPLINGLTELEHPCQVLADLLTIMEHRKMKHPKQLAGIKLTYLGDGNNMAHSLMLASTLLGIKLMLACPAGFEPKVEIRNKANELKKQGKGEFHVLRDPLVAARGADAVYTDVWTSMGQESELQYRQNLFAPYQLNAAVLKEAKPQALAMHCLPAHRGEEITEDVLEGPQSVIFDQAENRLHVQKAVLVTLLSKKRS
ncbi:MAG: Ornithine carbamoyltransferase [Elusimicrobia bacterium]|nr:Ornithine carbamoyltransferase [Elusimicrobiota bacterium]